MVIKGWSVTGRMDMAYRVLVVDDDPMVTRLVRIDL